MKFKIFPNTFLFAVLFIVCSCAKISNIKTLEALGPELKSKGGYESYLALEYLDSIESSSFQTQKKDQIFD